MIQYSGLCSSCKNAPNCTYPRSAGRPITQCEEFEGFQCRSAGNSTENISQSFAGVKAEERNQDKNLGLCRNCENLSSCKFPKPEGGIWHCEEYQ